MVQSPLTRFLKDQSVYYILYPFTLQSKNESIILFFCHGSHYLAHFSMLIFPTFALWIQNELDLSLAHTLNLGFWMYLFFGLFSLPVGYLNDRWKQSSRWFLIVFLIGTSLGYLWIAAAKSVVNLRIALLFLGIVSSIYHPVGMALISKSIRKRGGALGKNGIFGTLGIVMAPLLAGLVAHLWGWRWGYVLFCFFPFIFGIVLLRVRFSEDLVSHSAQASKQGRASRLWLLGLVLVATFFLGLNYRAAVSVAPSYVKIYAAGLLEFWMDVLRMKADTVSIQSSFAAAGVAGIYIFGMIGQILGGFLADRVDLKKGYFFFHLFSVPMLVGMWLCGDSLLLVAFLGYAFFSIGMQPLENSLIASLSPVHRRGLVYGVKFVFILGSSAMALKSLQLLEGSFGLRSIFFVSLLQLCIVLGILIAVIVSSSPVNALKKQNPL